jgi:hypothetical protein
MPYKITEDARAKKQEINKKVAETKEGYRERARENAKRWRAANPERASYMSSMGRKRLIYEAEMKGRGVVAEPFAPMPRIRASRLAVMVSDEEATLAIMEARKIEKRKNKNFPPVRAPTTTCLSTAPKTR